MNTPALSAPGDLALPDPQAAVSIRNLSHQYPTRLALDGVSLDIRQGEIFGILGPNGSGKTTLFRVLTTLLRPTHGAVYIFGHDVIAQPHQARARMGVLFQSPSLDGKLTARENLLHQGHLYGLHGAALHERIHSLLNDFGLAERRAERVERFSGGMRRRVELAKAMLHQPRLLILDEPATGLDPGARRDLWTVLQRMREQQQMTIALTTHLMEEADRSDRLAIMANGRMAALGEPRELKASIGGDIVTIEPEDPADAEALRSLLEESFGPWPANGKPVLHDGRIRLETSDGGAFVARLTQRLGARARSITIGKPTLEDVFLHLTGHTFWR